MDQCCKSPVMIVNYQNIDLQIICIFEGLLSNNYSMIRYSLFSDYGGAKDLTYKLRLLTQLLRLNVLNYSIFSDDHLPYHRNHLQCK